MERIVQVNLGERSYPIIIDNGLLDSMGKILQENGCNHLAVIADEKVEMLWGNRFRDALNGAGIRHLFFRVKPGERHKNLASARSLWNELADNKVDRGWWIASFGGGMVGDLAGFVAASYMRGLDFLQIPTSLLAQVDASIGGKVAIDHPKGKNLLGFFYQPKLVLIDTAFLHTLSPRQYRNGLAEVIKYGAIKDKELLELLKKEYKQVHERKEELLVEIVDKCVKLKAEYVERDEKDVLGIRAQLNFGHTIGHIIERESGFRLLHGESISIGMVFAGELSFRLGFLSSEELGELKDLLSLYSLPIALTFPISAERIMEGLHWDKKVKEGRIRFVLLRKLGEAFLFEEVPPELIKEVALKLGATA